MTIEIGRNLEVTAIVVSLVWAWWFFRSRRPR